MLLSGTEDEYRMRRRFLEGLQEGVERGLRKHVNLVYDIHAVASDLRRNLDLVHQGLDVVHSVVGCCIQLAYAVGASFGEGQAGLALAARIHIRSGIGTVDGFCKDAGSGSLSHSARTAEKISVCKLAAKNRVLQRPGNHILSYKRFKRVGTVFSGRYDII